MRRICGSGQSRHVVSCLARAEFRADLNDGLVVWSSLDVVSRKSVKGTSARNSARLDPAVRTAVAERVKQLSDGRYTRRALASKTGLGIGTVMDLFAGRSDPSLSTMLALVEALELRSIEELLGPLTTESMLRHQRSSSVSARSA